MSIGHFLNTRPSTRAAALTTAVLQAGWRVTELPLLELVALPLSESELDCLQLLTSDPVSVIVVVSPTAANMGLQALARLGIAPDALAIRWLAVGQGTAQVLQAHNLYPDIPMIETSEGLIASDLLASLPAGAAVMVWRGEGGRELVQERLLARGVSLQIINLYCRQLPESSLQQWISLEKKSDSDFPSVVLLSSGESWRYWQRLAGARALEPWLLVLGQRLMVDVSQYTSRVQQLIDLQPAHIVSVLAELGGAS
ncbi:uroporphyrinogen-III synthase [Aquirhabdus parva]|uniref:Uroporphyrinogen-III synthase n=1 Tax=Aquirhabdus parva TaxID=2283318 RepID=A0A345P366_9GAMM|nr:uroporphyrinogen-III synthase [Aquirhabdus parva]AXI01725.1 uroporphyrinogen-III synthase [Aquirhabdus parva]